MVSAPVPPVMVSVLATVAVLAKLPKVRLSLPAPRSMEALTAAAPRVMVSAPVPPISVVVFLTVPVLATLARVSLLAAGAEVDRHGGGQRAAQGDGVGAGAAGDGLGVGDGRGVGEGAEGQHVGAGAEVDGGVGRWRCPG